MNTHLPPSPDGMIQPRVGSEDALAREFAVQAADYYVRAFARIRNATGRAWSFNPAAALLGPVWAASRNLLLLFWITLLLHIAAVAQISIGASGNQGAAEQSRAERLTQQAEGRAKQAQAAKDSGAANADGLDKSAKALERAATQAVAAATAARAQGPRFLATGLATLLLSAALSGLLANGMLERRFTRWRSDRTIHRGRNHVLASFATLFCVAIFALTAYRFATAAPAPWLAAAPSNRGWQAALSSGLDTVMHQIAQSGDTFFSLVTRGLSGFLDALAYALTAMPWPVTMALILLLAWQLAGPRVAIFTGAALAYLSLLGFWEKSLDTVALLGTAAILCLAIGIPLGIWCGRRPRVDAAIRPVLDFMQTMPAFVYLIPVIALFGIGKPPGIIATLIFGTPPVVRLTALGLQGVPSSIREAAQAYGATRWFLLTRVDLPLAKPSIMAGINQTILMCLSMVVIASLIGAKGLGEDVLNALQYAAVGQGLLAGFAILLCAMVIDRIVQGNASQSGK
ncbi:proline/glycine betaine ABC transporter permease [Mesorhizobium sp. B4-1-1]|uniref:ABC transporter permease n=1 Tax=Mesorhizobium sp. B4-1-1 TaxID=2589890 RepID=UPI001AEF1186|nr:proline/glycine betaine ABC transporter permease [Mesorhizobium sp. B4-1-1]